MFCTLFFSNKNKKTPEGALIEVLDSQWVLNGGCEAVGNKCAENRVCVGHQG